MNKTGVTTSLSMASAKILLPEVPEEATVKNIFQTSEIGLPNFRELTAEKCYAGMGGLCLDYESGIWSLEEKIIDGTQPKTFHDIIETLDELGSPLTTAWGTVKTLYTVQNNVISTASYLKIHERAQKARSRKFQSQPIYNACKEIYIKDTKLDDLQKRVVNKYLLEGRLNGVSLPLKQRDTLNYILLKLDEEKKLYRMKLKDSSRRFSYRIVDINIVKDFPEKLLKEMSFNRNEHLKGPWTVSHNPLVYQSFMEYCPDKELRWNAWHTYILRSSVYLHNELSTGLQVEEIRSRRQEQAKLLGYKNFAEMSMETKMAGSVENVFGVISNLLTKAKIQQTEEIESLRDFAESRGHSGSLDECDIPFWRRKQRNFLYRSDTSELKKFFPFEHVWTQLLDQCSNLFGIFFEEVPKNSALPNTWHSDVRLFEVKNLSGKNLGYFYLDPYHRPGEKLQTYPDSAWMISLWGRSKVAGKDPVAALIFNFPAPGVTESLLNFNDVQSLFKKFGHALHHLLSTVPYGTASGLTNIEWDAVEVSSNLLLNWLYQPSVLKKISKHHVTGEPLDGSQIEDIRMTRTHFAGYDLCQELFLSHFDLKIYSDKEFWLDSLKELWPMYIPFDYYKKHSLPCWFSPIITETWAAAYYSHFWARMLAADVFGAFQECDPEEWPTVGKRYRDTFLSLGGGCHPSEVFRKFRGRDPNPAALHDVLCIS